MLKLNIGCGYRKKEDYGKKIVRFFSLKNKHLLLFLPLFFGSWFVYYEFFMKWFDFIWRFVPTYILGFLSCYVIRDSLTHAKEKERNET